MNKFETIYIAKSRLINCNEEGVDSVNFGASAGREVEQFEFSPILGKKHVALVGGGMSAEREVSFMSSKGVAASLLELGHQVTFIDMGADIAQVLGSLQPDVVFNALHGTYGEDGCLPALLNIMHIPYTGCGVMSSALALNKKKSNEIFRANNIRVADSILVKKSDNIKGDPMRRPYVIKPLSQGSSVGIEIIFEEDDFSFADYDFLYGDEIIVEKYIKGREIQVAVLNGKARGVLEIKILENRRFYDYEVKYTEGLAEHLLPAPIPGDAYDEVMRISERACSIFECESGIIRVEFIYSHADNKMYMLELNTHPGMTPLSICPEIMESVGTSYTRLVDTILKEAKFEI